MSVGRYAGGPSLSSNTVHGQSPGVLGGAPVVNAHWYGAAMVTRLAAVAVTVAVYWCRGRASVGRSKVTVFGPVSYVPGTTGPLFSARPG